MRNIFKRKKTPKSSEPQTLPIEEEISTIINKYTRSRHNCQKSDFMHFSKIVKDFDKSNVFSICSGFEQYPLTIIMRNSLSDTRGFIEEIHELLRMEVLQYSYNNAFYEELLWSVSGSDLFTNETPDYFIAIRDFERDTPSTNSIEVRRSREFAFGQLLLGDTHIHKSPVVISYRSLLFSEETELQKGDTCFQSTLSIDGKKIRLFLKLKGDKRVSSIIAKSLIAQQKTNLGKALRKEIKIVSAGISKDEDLGSFTGFSLNGQIHTAASNIPYILLFPKKLINLFPDYVCTTIKGKILQINKELFRSGFQTFYKPGKHFLLADFLSIVEERDLRLICQNFFVSNSYRGDDLKNLFFYKAQHREKTKIQREPFICAQDFVDHLPLRLKEDFQRSRSYSMSHNDLLAANQLILDRIYEQISSGKLLLSYKSQFILHRESGAHAKESKTLRLRKLIGDKSYINHLEKMDSKKVQIMLGTMKNILIVDTFIYQTDELVKLKQFLSKNRFNELKEDISYTQGKIKTRQIDINRICDSIEKFNQFLRDFIEKDKSISEES